MTTEPSVITTAPLARGAYPIRLDLPGGTQARVRIVHVWDDVAQTLTQAVSSPPIYELRDGTTVDADVTIPDDLRAAGWFWWGSFLSWCHAPDAVTVSVATCTFGIPGVFAQARELERIKAEIHITSLEIRAKVKPTKKGKRDKREPVQAEMGL